MVQSKVLAPIALVIAVAAGVFIYVQHTAIKELDRRVAAQAQVIEGVAKHLAQAPPAPARTDAAPAAPSVDASMLSAIEARLAAAEREVRATSVLARAASVRPGEVSGAPVDGDDGLLSLADELAALRTDVDALLTGRGLESPEAKAALKAALEEARSQAREERRERRAAAEAAWLDRFAEEAGLSEAQHEAVRALLDADRETRRSLWAAVREGDKTRDEVRQERRAMREQTDARLAEILDAEQLEAFNETRRGPRGWGDAPARDGESPRRGSPGGR